MAMTNTGMIITMVKVAVVIMTQIITRDTATNVDGMDLRRILKLSATSP